MNNIKCQIPNHLENKITSVCLNKNCEDKRLCCQICIGEIHNNHIDKIIKVEGKSLECIKKIIQSFTQLGQGKKLQFSKQSIELAGHEAQVNQVTISQDGQLIASGSPDQTVKLWDGKTKTLLQTIKNESIVYCVAISSKNEYLAFDVINTFITLYDLNSKKVKWTYKQKQRRMSTIRCIIFSQDTQYLLFGGDDERLTIWSLLQNKIISCFKIHSAIYSIVISQNNKLAACICQNGKIYIMDLITKNIYIQQAVAHKIGYGLCSSADSSIYISSGGDGLIKIWKLKKCWSNRKTLTLAQSIQTASKKIDQVLLTLDDMYIISYSNRVGQILIHERETGKLIQVLESGKVQYRFAAISMSNDMNTLVSSNFLDKTFRVWTRE